MPQMDQNARILSNFMKTSAGETENKEEGEIGEPVHGGLPN
jgi:hypothetical protein